MYHTIYRLDFRDGTVKEIDERTPPRGWPAGADRPPETLPSGGAFRLASLGSPPELLSTMRASLPDAAHARSGHRV